MTDAAGLRSSTEIHEYLLGLLNQAVRRHGMYGGEVTLRLLFDHLSFVEGTELLNQQQQDAWNERGAFSPTGVKGAFGRHLPDDLGDSMASLYGEAAWSRGWLVPDRTLSSTDYTAMRTRALAWAAEDHTYAAVIDAFGPPSVLFGGPNPFYGKVLGYLSDRRTDPMIAFHLWNGSDPAEPDLWHVYDNAVLLAVRCGHGPLADAFIYTPEGEARRPH